MKHDEDHEARKAQRAARYHASDIYDKLIINLRDLSHTMRFLYEGRGSQKQILIVLNEVGNITQRALTERLGIQPGSASEVIAKLEGSGCIQRTPSETDRRTTDIELTIEGKRLADEAAQQRRRRHEDMFCCLKEDEKGALLSLLERLNADWDQRYRDDGQRHDRRDPCHGRHAHHGKEHS